MSELLTVLIDTIFPPSADILTIRSYKNDFTQAFYQPGLYREIIYLANFQNPLVQAAVRENKFHHNKQAAQILSTLLKKWPALNDPNTVFIPIPLGKKRLRERGHNQVETILRAAGLTDRLHTNILERTLETLPQSHLTKTARAQNIKKAFSFTKQVTVLQKYQRVILLDDVATTGATLEAARAVLTRHLPKDTKLQCVALAH